MSDEKKPTQNDDATNKEAQTPQSSTPKQPSEAKIDSDLEKSLVEERADKDGVEDKAIHSESDDESSTEASTQPKAKQGTNKAKPVVEADDTAHEDAIVAEAESDTPDENIKTDASIVDDEDEEDSSEKPSAPKNAQEEVDDAVAEDSEDDSNAERHEIEKKNYESMSQVDLADELESLIKNEKVQAIKEHVDEIRNEFNNKFDEEAEQKKEEFLEEGGNIIDFHYVTPIKKRFDSLYFDYREKRNNHYKQLKKDLNDNLKKREDIIEELKNMIGVGNDMHSNYNDFKAIQERWRQAGPIPRDKYNLVWNNYHHHVENFYDFLHLDREFRDLDFKHNLEQKLKIISRAEDLAKEKNVNRSFRELQMLHKMWKEDVGPVAKEHRDLIWDKFSELTKTIHDNRQAHFAEMEKDFEKNLEAKQGIIAKIAEIAQDDIKSHGSVQKKIKAVEALREEFFKAGKVPREKNQATWDSFKKTVREFNRKKNGFYKNQKQEQYANLEKKKALIKIAEDNKDSDDLATVTPLMKKIQAEWRTIGHVPRKDSDKIWKQFKAACNHYFDRMHAERKAENAELFEAFDKKKDMLDTVKELKLEGTAEEKLKTIKEHIAAWKDLGPVPQNKRFIEGKFNKALDELFGDLDISRKKQEMLKYESRLQALENADDQRSIDKETYFIRKKVDETTAEIAQLENNLGFFQHVPDDNPMVQEVHKNINKHKEELEMWKAKLQKLRAL